MDFSRIILRYTVAFLMLAHGIPKLLHVHSFIIEIGQWIPYPFNWILGPLTILVEFGGGLALISGYFVRITGLLVGILYSGIAVLVHVNQLYRIFNLNPRDGQTDFEYPFLLAAVGFSLFLKKNK